MNLADFEAAERDRLAVNALVTRKVAETRPLRCNQEIGCGKMTGTPSERNAVLYNDYVIILCTACDEREQIASGAPF